MDKYIAKQIILDQVASESGKGLYGTLNSVISLLPIAKVYRKNAYWAKDHSIIQAIKCIQIEG